MAAVGVLTLRFTLQLASPDQRNMLATEWAVWLQALVVAALVWTAISILYAPLSAIRDDRERGKWIGGRGLYYEPLLVSVSIWTPGDADRCVNVVFDDAEKDAFIRYRIELDPPAAGRVSAYLERQPGELDGIFGSILSPSGKPGKAGGTGSIGMVGREAYLRVKLDPQTVPVTARLFMTDFSMGEVVL